jgi:prepilin-type N-terminal cleavage/methylation domain-containing protein
MLRSGERRTPTADDGFTLVELMVVLALFSIVSVIAFNFLNSTTSHVGKATNDALAEDNARLALRTVTEDVRGAAHDATLAFASSTACAAGPNPSTCISFTVKRPTTAKPDCISQLAYGLVGTTLRGTRSDTNCATSVSYTGKIVLSSLSNGTTPVFTYFGGDGSPLSASQLTADPTRVAAVGITLKIQFQANAPAITMASVATLRNAR